VASCDNRVRVATVKFLYPNPQAAEIMTILVNLPTPRIIESSRVSLSSYTLNPEPLTLNPKP